MFQGVFTRIIRADPCVYRICMPAEPRTGDTYLAFDGTGAYACIPSHPRYSVDYTGQLAIAVWVRVDTGNFPHNEHGYVHWMGKGQRSGLNGDREWAFRIYNADHQGRQRTSFYVFNFCGGLGVGSRVDEQVPQGSWRLIAANIDEARTQLFKNGILMDCDTYKGKPTADCKIMFDDCGNQVVICPVHGDAPIRLGTRDGASHFRGGLTRFRIWNRTLSAAEMTALYMTDTVPNTQLAGEFLLNASTDGTIEDTVLANDGTIHGATWVVQ
ncbi:hypothetical protein AYO47_01600 [Planctomyces sp. SCGC AG-212-M04]|nr:hypothetical protein AYO47_01600 [Planctomyces sp. SCGC AG-212-M04]